LVLKEKKTTLALYTTESFKEKILNYIGYDSKSGLSQSEALVKFFEKLILNKDSLQTSNQTPTSDLPETKRNLLDPSLPQETLKARKEFLEKVNSPPSYPIPPCHYASKDKFIDPKTGLQCIYCDNPKRTKGKPLQIPLIACVKCWERREWFNKQRKNTPKEIKEIYCKQSGLWVKPTACINCKTPCEKAPPTNPYLSDIQRYHNSQNQKER